MAGEWQTRTLRDFCRKPNGGIQTGPFGSQLHRADYVDAGVPVIMPTNIQAGRLVEDGIARVSEAKADELKRHRIRLGDIIFARRGEVDKCAVVTEHEVNWLCGTGCLLARVDPKLADARYIGYHISLPETRAWLQQNAVGLVMPNLNTGILESIPIRAPSRIEQEQIANLLASLDAKIDLNREMAVTLEAMARALFKSWFVDFDPVHAKAERRNTGLPADIAALFPDNLDNGGLPEGWSHSTVGQLFTVVAGNTPSTKQAEYWGGPHAWATPKDMSGLPGPLLTRTERSLTEQGFGACSSGEIPPMSLLMSSRAPVGYLTFNSLPVSINQGIAAFVANKLSPYYAWAWCHENMKLIKANANGSTFQEISKGVLRTISMIEPSQAVHDVFVAVVETTFSRIVELAEEAASIISLRDELLPKLLTGELRVDDAAASIAAA